jgi:type 1 glutamine amidotransferase
MNPMLSRRALLAALPALPALAARKRSALLIDGQNNHAWIQTTPLLQRYLEQTGLFTVTVSTTPPKGGDMEAYRPKFAGHDIVVLNYNGEDWSKTTEADFVRYVRSGGGLVVVHAANNAFPTWPEFNEMIGLGGWGNRNEKDGPYLRLREGKWVPDTQPGRGGSHGAQHPYLITLRDPNHPITKGLPAEWLHAKDELYDRLRGPAKNVRILASAFSDKSTRGTGEHEPLIMVLSYGKGRIFHTCLGHAVEAMQSVDFIVTYQRGAEWAASGKVTQMLPADFPGKDKVSSRP